jgi:hypothetical protein
VQYFEIQDNLKASVLSGFLKSKHIDYFGKINLLKQLVTANKRSTNIEDLKRKPLISKKIIASLKAIGAVRNAFHHNLEYTDALDKLTDGDRFQYQQECKTLDKYNKGLGQADVDTLVQDYKHEVTSVYCDLHEILINVSNQIS